jgi:hypothetical protein
MYQYMYDSKQSIMYMKSLFFIVSVSVSLLCFAQPGPGLQSFLLKDSITITFDIPGNFNVHNKTITCFYALPNGNTTSQTFGKRVQPGDDWHFDIQHIGAQTQFIRKELKEINFIVIYLENVHRSWPLWKQRHPDFPSRLPALIDSLSSLFGKRNRTVYLNGHSGGGSLVFGYLKGIKKIPRWMRRISFIDSNYGYDSSYYPLISRWLKRNKTNALNVFAYNDSVALYKGKPVVSAQGGTWYKSRQLIADLQKDFVMKEEKEDSMIIYKSKEGRIQFFLKPNPDQRIYHTQQVELNGFIHSILCGTPADSKNYTYYGQRAYNEYLK